MPMTTMMLMMTIMTIMFKKDDQHGDDDDDNVDSSQKHQIVNSVSSCCPQTGFRHLLFAQQTKTLFVIYSWVCLCVQASTPSNTHKHIVQCSVIQKCRWKKWCRCWGRRGLGPITLRAAAKTCREARDLTAVWAQVHRDITASKNKLASLKGVLAFITEIRYDCF